jgi:Uma2 family endonuclease
MPIRALQSLFGAEAPNSLLLWGSIGPEMAMERGRRSDIVKGRSVVWTMHGCASQIPVRMSVEEFLNWDSGDCLRYELVDGEPHAVAPASRTHGILQGRLATLINNHLDREKRPCSLIVEHGVVPRLLPDHNVCVPDLAVTCAPYETEEAVMTDPVIVIEIFSLTDQAKTWTNVWAYTSIPSIREILVLRADRIGAELLRRSPRGEWPERLAAIDDGDVVLESIGFRVGLTELYRGTRRVS